MTIMKHGGLPHLEACTLGANPRVCASFLIRADIYLLPHLLLMSFPFFCQDMQLME